MAGLGEELAGAHAQRDAADEDHPIQGEAGLGFEAGFGLREMVPRHGNFDVIRINPEARGRCGSQRCFERRFPPQVSDLDEMWRVK